MSKQAETYLGQRAQTLAAAVESLTGSPSSGEGFPRGSYCHLVPNQTPTHSTSRLLRHSPAVPCVKCIFWRQLTPFRQHLQMKVIFSGFGRSKTMKPHPAAMAGFKRSVSRDGTEYYPSLTP